MEILSSEAATLEEARIRAVYAGRQADGRYSLFSPGHLFMVQERERRVLVLLKQFNCVPLDTRKILEIGCGTGYWIREFIKWGARPEHITGVDLLSERVVEARRLSPGGVRIHSGSAVGLDLPDGSFDLVLQSTVFTSILDSNVKQQVAYEMMRLVKADGLILWYDYHVNNPWNPDVRGVKKLEIHRLFPRCRVQLRRITLVAPLTRVIAPYSWLLCHLLGKIPLLCTHYLGIIRKT